MVTHNLWVIRETSNDGIFPMLKISNMANQRIFNIPLFYPKFRGKFKFSPFFLEHQSKSYENLQVSPKYFTSQSEKAVLRLESMKPPYLASHCKISNKGTSNFSLIWTFLVKNELSLFWNGTLFGEPFLEFSFYSLLPRNNDCLTTKKRYESIFFFRI